MLFVHGKRLSVVELELWYYIHISAAVLTLKPLVHKGHGLMNQGRVRGLDWKRNGENSRLMCLVEQRQEGKNED